MRESLRQPRSLAYACRRQFSAHLAHNFAGVGQGYEIDVGGLMARTKGTWEPSARCLARAAAGSRPHTFTAVSGASRRVCGTRRRRLSTPAGTPGPWLDRERQLIDKDH